MTEETKKNFWESQEDVAKAVQEAAEQYDRKCDEYWNSLSYDDKLMVFHSVCKRIYEGDVVKEGSYRYVLYEVFGFDKDSYLIGMDCSYMELHNYIQEGVSSLRNYKQDEKL